MHTFKYILFSFLFSMTLPVLAQNDDSGAVDRTDVYWGETAEREKIQASDLPTEVRIGFEKSEYSDMDLLDVQKIIARPLKDSEDPYRTASEDNPAKADTGEDMDMLDSTYEERPYRMREDKRDIAETYYQDTYDNPETLSDSLITEDAFKDTTNTYYEIEVNGKVASYKLIFDKKGNIQHTEIMDS